MNNRKINVKDKFDSVYRELGYIPLSNLKNDPRSKAYIEQEARKRALAHLDGFDRAQIETFVKRIKEACPGVYLGDSAALQILEHLGIFLTEVANE